MKRELHFLSALPLTAPLARTTAAAVGAGLLALPQLARAVDTTWIATTGGNWSSPAHWSGGVVPNTVEHRAFFGGSIAAPSTVTQNIPGLTLGGIVFNNASHAYTIDASNAINLGVSSGAGSGQITVLSGSGHTVAAPIALLEALVAGGFPGTDLTLSGPISGPGHGFSKQVGGTLTLSGSAANTYTGNTEVSGGTLRLAKTGGARAIPGIGLIIGTGSGTFGGSRTAHVIFDQGSALADSTHVVINGSGQLDGGGIVNTIGGGLDMTGGRIVNANLRLTSNVATHPSPIPSTIEGTGISPVSGVRTFTVADGLADEDLILTVPVVGTGGLIKAGPGTMRLGAANQHSQGTAVNSGRLILAHPGAAGPATLTIAAGALVIVEAGLPSAARFAAPPVLAPGATLEVNHSAVIDYPFGGSPLAMVQAAVSSAFNGGDWSGPGIRTAMATATGLGVGYAEASAIFTSFPTTFDGQLIDNTTVLLRPTRFGDANLDGVVNLQDFNRLASNFGTVSGAVWSMGDFNYDTIVNLQDFNRLATNFGLGASGPEVTPDDWAALAAVVPEPASVLLVLTGVPASVGVFRPRSRRRISS